MAAGLHWCGGLTEIRKIAALATAYDTPVIHVGGTPDCLHFIMAIPNAPWGSFLCRRLADLPKFTGRWEEDNRIARGPEGVYTVPSDEPGLGWDFEVA